MRLTSPASSRRFLAPLAVLTLLVAPPLTADPAGEADLAGEKDGKVMLPTSAPADGALARFLAATEGMTMRERYRHGRALPGAQRKQLLAEYHALPETEKASFKAAIPRGEKAVKARKLGLTEKAAGSPDEVHSPENGEQTVPWPLGPPAHCP